MGEMASRAAFIELSPNELLRTYLLRISWLVVI